MSVSSNYPKKGKSHGVGSKLARSFTTEERRMYNEENFGMKPNFRIRERKQKTNKAKKPVTRKRKSCKK
jgi:hypothetical protein